MVYVNGLKYACGACIKGHRSSSCSHTDRPLFEIKKKGRPVTQCEHCRQLRKTKQVHVKCSCGGSSEDALPETRGKAKRKIPTLAAFPDGLDPHGATPSPATKAPSSSSCGCKSTGRCSCSTPILKKFNPLESSSSSSSSSAPSSAPITPPPTSCCSGKKRNPNPKYDLPPSLPLQPDIGVDVDIATYAAPSDLIHPTPRTYTSTSYLAPDISISTPFSWKSGSGVGSCSCGITCACPGCIDHADPSTALMSSESCPYACTACVHCNGFGFAPLPTLGPSADHTDPTAEATTSTLTSTSNTLAMWSSSPALPGLMSASTCASASASASALAVSDCCGGACQCSTQYLSCQCTSDCCGCCFGCECSEPEEEEAGRASLRFAVSGERGSCCSETKVKGEGEGKGESMEELRKKKRRVEA